MLFRAIILALIAVVPLRALRGLGKSAFDTLSHNMNSNLYLSGAAILTVAGLYGQEFHPSIPRAWDDKAVAGFETPLAQRDRSPRYMTADEYYKLKVRPIYRSYPMYAKGREPAGYIESLKQKEPEIIFDASKLHTKQDWIEAGKLVFEAEILYRPVPAGGPPNNPVLPADADGKLPPYGLFAQYFIREKGVLEVANNACAGCHTRIMPDGSIVEGAQGNIPAAPSSLKAARDTSPAAFRQRVENDWVLFGAPWIMSKEAFQSTFSKELYVRQVEARTPHIFARQGTSRSYPPHVPSLIGVADIKFLDATGLVRHRSIGDLMRYSITNQGLDTLAHYGNFQPGTAGAINSSEPGMRYSDEQLYALALYLYSLKPPPNPNAFDDRARRGQRVFQAQGCGGCHTPPYYTNNKLTPAAGFAVPEDLLKSGDVMNISVGTDPTLATQTRRGTGFYKVPSLRGVWFRNGFGHGGWAETLEEWLDPARLSEGYVPKGFHLAPGSVRGHEFGLKLTLDDRAALIAFLKTL